MDQEERAQQQALRHSHEMSAMRDQLAEAESAKNTIQNEVRRESEREREVNYSEP